MGKIPQLGKIPQFSAPVFFFSFFLALRCPLPFPPFLMKKFPLYFTGVLTGNPVFFGFWPTEKEAAQIGAACVEKNEMFCAFFIGAPCFVSE